MNCPICKRPVPPPPTDASDRGSFPFCSPRCKLIDLGRWLGGAYQIPVEAPSDDGEDAGPPGRQR